MRWMRSRCMVARPSRALSWPPTHLRWKILLVFCISSVATHFYIKWWQRLIFNIFLAGVWQHPQHRPVCKRLHGWACFPVRRGTHTLESHLNTQRQDVQSWILDFSPPQFQNNPEPDLEVVVCSGYGKNGALAVLQVSKSFFPTSAAPSEHVWWRGPSATAPVMVLK